MRIPTVNDVLREALERLSWSDEMSGDGHDVAEKCHECRSRMKFAGAALERAKTMSDEQDEIQRLREALAAAECERDEYREALKGMLAAFASSTHDHGSVALYPCPKCAYDLASLALSEPSQ